MTRKRTWQGKYVWRCTGWSLKEGTHDYIVVELPDGRNVEVPVTSQLLKDLAPATETATSEEG